MKVMLLLLVAALLGGCLDPGTEDHGRRPAPSPPAVAMTPVEPSPNIPPPDGNVSASQRLSATNVTANDCTEYYWRYTTPGDAPARVPPAWQDAMPPYWGAELVFYDCARFNSGNMEAGPASFILELIPIENAPDACWQGADLARYLYRVWANDTRVADAFAFLGLPTESSQITRTADGGQPVNTTTWVVEVDDVASTFAYREGTLVPNAHVPSTFHYLWSDGVQAARLAWTTSDSDYHSDAVNAADGDPQPPLLASYGTAPKVGQAYLSTNADAQGAVTWFANLDCTA